MAHMERRTFLASLGVAAVAPAVNVQSPAIPIIDAHIHLFDREHVRRARPTAVPRSPGRAGTGVCRLAIARSPCRSASSARSRSKRARGSRTTSGCSRSPQRDPIIVGVIGNLEPEKPEFPEYLERYRKNPLFRGIRCGNLWGRDITQQVESTGVHRRAEAASRRRISCMDTANPRLSLLQAIVRVTDKVPDASRRPRSSARADAVRDGRRSSRRYDAVLRELGARPQVYVKLSAIIHQRERAGLDRSRQPTGTGSTG